MDCLDEESLSKQCLLNECPKSLCEWGSSSSQETNDTDIILYSILFGSIGLIYVFGCLGIVFLKFRVNNPNFF